MVQHVSEMFRTCFRMFRKCFRNDTEIVQKVSEMFRTSFRKCQKSFVMFWFQYIAENSLQIACRKLNADSMFQNVSESSDVFQKVLEFQNSTFRNSFIMFQNVSEMLRNCIRRFETCFGNASESFRARQTYVRQFQNVSEMLRKCFRMFRKCFRNVSEIAQKVSECFRNVSDKFQKVPDEFRDVLVSINRREQFADSLQIALPANVLYIANVL